MKLNCSCGILLLIFNLLLGTWSFAYVLWNVFGKTAPAIADIIGGILLGEFTFPGAIVVWILSLAGVHFR